MEDTYGLILTSILTIGVPRGSMLGPLFIIIHIIFGNAGFSLHAKDTTSVISDKRLQMKKTVIRLY